MPYFHNFLTIKTPIKIIFGLIYRLLCNIYKKTKRPKTVKVLNNGHFGRFSELFRYCQNAEKLPFL